MSISLFEHNILFLTSSRILHKLFVVIPLLLTEFLHRTTPTILLVVLKRKRIVYF